MIRFSYSRIAFYLFISFILIACVQPTSISDVNINMTLEMLPDPPVVGGSELAITLTDENDMPITDATLEIVGDMNHAGMIPVVRDIETAGEDGIYRIPFEWSMGGDWFVTVFAILKDGTEVEQIFDMTVAMADDAKMDHSEMDHSEMDHSEMDSDTDESHSEDGHSEDMDHSDSHGSEAEHSQADHSEDHHSEDMDHSDSATEGNEKEEMANSQTIDTSILHEIDEAARNGTIETDTLNTLQAFIETLDGLPDEYTPDVEALHITLADFEAAMDAEDMDTATARISEMHDMVHDMKIRLTNSGEESEPAKNDEHKHTHD